MAMLPEITPQQDGERLLTPEELATLMRVKLSWVHQHGHKLPFAIRLLGQQKVKRYSYAGYVRYIRQLEGR